MTLTEARKEAGIIQDSTISTKFETEDFVRVANELRKKLNKPMEFKVPFGVSYAHAFHKARIYGQQLKPGHFNKKGGPRCISKKAKILLDEVYGINEGSIRLLVKNGSLQAEKQNKENKEMSPRVAKKIADKIKAKKNEDLEDDDDLDQDDDDLEFEEDEEDEDDDDLDDDEDEDGDVDEDDTPAPPKRGPGRPKKSESTPVKKGPGRPKKNVVEDDDEDIPAPKRGPGRPAKSTPAKKEDGIPSEVVEAIATVLNFLKS